MDLGSSFELSIRYLTEVITRLTGFEGEIRWDTTKPNTHPHRKLDVIRAELCIGFRSRTTFEDGLKRTIGWRGSLQAARS